MGVGSRTGVGSCGGEKPWAGLAKSAGDPDPGSLMDRLRREFARNAEFVLAMGSAKGWAVVGMS